MRGLLRWLLLMWLLMIILPTLVSSAASLPAQPTPCAFLFMEYAAYTQRFAKALKQLHTQFSLATLIERCLFMAGNLNAAKWFSSSFDLSLSLLVYA